MADFLQHSRARYLPVFLVFLGGLVLSILIFFGFHRSEVNATKARFYSVCLDKISRMETEIEANAEVIYGLQSFFAASEEITLEEFEFVCSSILDRRKGVGSLGFVERVPSHSVGGFAKGLAQLYPQDFFEQDYFLSESSTQVPGEEDGVAFLVKFIAPRAENTALLGANLASTKGRVQALVGARDSGRPTITEGLYLLLGDPRLSVLLFLPVFSLSDLERFEELGVKPQLSGFVFGSFYVDTLLNPLDNNGRPENLAIIVEDLSGLRGPQEIYSSIPPGRKKALLEGSDSSLSFQTQIAPFGRTWRLTFFPLGEALSTNPSLQAFAILGFSILLTALITSYLLFILGQKDRIQTEVDIRTEELHQAIRTAEEATQAKGNFLAMMSHEIRTPINGIVGYTHLIRNKYSSLPGVPPKFAEYLFKLDNSAGLLLTLVNNVLDLAKFEAGNLDVSFEDIEIRAQVKHIFDSYHGKGEQRGVKVKLRFKEGLQEFYRADLSKLSQVITNLLGNAIKFTPRGRVVELIVGPEEDGVLIQVRDQGIGIPKEKCQSIFQAYEQADTSTSRRYGGTGLGLSIVKHIVEELGGSISLESVLGKGSTFSVFLPMEVVEGALCPIGEKGRILFDSKQKLLVVEDNSDNREIIEELLRSHGIREIVMAEDGLKGIEAAKTRGPFSLIIMDYHMPRCTGVEALKRIQSYWDSEGQEYTPVILLTADVSEGTKKLGLEAGFDLCMSKPINPDLFITGLSRFLDTSNLDLQEMVEEISISPDLAKACLEIVERIKVIPAHRAYEAAEQIDGLRVKLGSSSPSITNKLNLLEIAVVDGKFEEIQNICKVLLDLFTKNNKGEAG